MNLRSKAKSRAAPVRRIFLRPALTAEQTLALRALMVIALLGLVLAAFWFDRDALRDGYDGQVSFVDLLYFTMVTVTTVGYGDIVPVGDTARLIDAFVVTPVRLLVWFIFLGTAYQFVVQRIIEDFRMKRLQAELSGHVILCGYGHAGQVAAAELIDKGTPPGQMVVIDPIQARVEEASELGMVGVCGDATQESLLRDLQCHKASSAVLCLPRDDTALLCLLTLRFMAKDLKIIALVREEENVKLVRRSGAHLVVAPSRVSGQLVADAVHGRFLAPFLLDLISTRGRFKLIELEADEHWVGKKMNGCGARLIVGLERNGRTIGFWDNPDEVIAEGDLLLVIERNPSAGEA